MKRIWTIIGISDMPGSFRWYQSLFGQPESRAFRLGQEWKGRLLGDTEKGLGSSPRCLLHVLAGQLPIETYRFVYLR